MQIQTSTQTHHNTIVDHCLVTLKLDSSSSSIKEEKEKPPNNSYIGRSTMAYSISAPPSLTLIGDYIGVESCLDLKNNVDIELDHLDAFSSPPKEEDRNPNHGVSSLQLNGKQDQGFGMRKWNKKKMTKNEFPPPIPLLARTGNLSSHMPWVLKRYYTSDGRLILWEEKVKHHEYFRAYRSNGHLTLQLVPLDDDVSLETPHWYEVEEEEEEEEEKGVEVNASGDCGYSSEEEGTNGVENVEVDNLYEEDERGPCNLEGGDLGGNGKCLSYSSVRTGSNCIFGVPVPSMRTVHS